jgi:hypothetical protein
MLMEREYLFSEMEGVDGFCDLVFFVIDVVEVFHLVENGGGGMCHDGIGLGRFNDGGLVIGIVQVLVVVSVLQKIMCIVILHFLVQRFWI